MGLKRLGPEAEGQSNQLRLLTVTLHVDLQDLGHVVSVDPHISQVVPQGGLILIEIGLNSLVVLKQTNALFF